MTTAATIVLILAVVILASAAVWYFGRQRTRELRARFGPEYDRTLHEYGSQSRAEEDLRKRQKRRESIHIRSLSHEERERYAERWRKVQAQFVDDPGKSINEADGLVSELMATRGYPMTGFENRVDDLSVDHPVVVQNYRAAHAIAVKNETGQATTEDLRKALVFERELFDELLGAQPVGTLRRRM